MIVGEFGYLTFGENFNISKLGFTESPSAGTAPLGEDSSSAGYLRCSVTWDRVGWMESLERKRNMFISLSFILSDAKGGTVLLYHEG